MAKTISTLQEQFNASRSDKTFAEITLQHNKEINSLLRENNEQKQEIQKQIAVKKYY